MKKPEENHQNCVTWSQVGYFILTLFIGSLLFGSYWIVYQAGYTDCNTKGINDETKAAETQIASENHLITFDASLTASP